MIKRERQCVSRDLILLSFASITGSTLREMESVNVSIESKVQRTF